MYTLEAVEAVESDVGYSNKMPSETIRKESPHRNTALVFLCLVAFGSLFGMDSMGILFGEFKNSLNISLDMIYSTYMILHWPNVFFCILHGFLIDHCLGLRYSIIIYSALIAIGQLLLFSSCFFQAFSLIMLGRFVFTVGAQSSIVAQNTYVGYLFKSPGRKRNLAFGLLVSFHYLGQLVTIQYLRSTYEFVTNFFSLEEVSLSATLLLVSMVSILSLLCALGLGIFDRHTYSIKREETENSLLSKTTNVCDIFTLKVEFWLLFVIMFGFYNAFYAFMRLLIPILLENFYLDYKDVEASTSVFLLATIVVSPLCGLVLDNLKRVTWLWIALGCALSSYTLINFLLFINAFTSIILMGIAYGIMSTAIWSLVAMLVPNHLWGTAFGLCGSVLNLSMTICGSSFMDDPNIANLTSPVHLFFIIMLSISILGTSILCILYRKHKETTFNIKLEKLSP